MTKSLKCFLIVFGLVECGHRGVLSHVYASLDLRLEFSLNERSADIASFFVVMVGLRISEHVVFEKLIVTDRMLFFNWDVMSLSESL